MRRRQVYALTNRAVVAVKPVQNAPAETNRHACPKCGKEFKRGLHLHLKHCKR